MQIVFWQLCLPAFSDVSQLSQQTSKTKRNVARAHKQTVVVHSSMQSESSQPSLVKEETLVREEPKYKSEYSVDDVKKWMYLITYKNLTVSAKMKCFSKKVFYIFCTTLSLLSGTTMHIQCIYYVVCSMPVSLGSYHRQALLQTFLWIRYICSCGIICKSYSYFHLLQ